MRRLSNLTPHQQAAFDAIWARLEAGERFTTLQGYAGTGKTYLIGRLIRRLTRAGTFVRVCAPTHKAAQVLQRHLPGSAVRAQTIHAFLGLRLVPDRRGGYTLEPEKGRRLPSDGVVIVDEASMVGMQEWTFVEQARGVRWVFVGDPAQLPPVNEDPSPVFSQAGPRLEEIVRQQRDNPILALATRVRHGEPLDLSARFENGQGIAVTRRTDAFLESALRAFSEKAFRDDSGFARVLAYRNQTVRAYNARIRAALHGASAPRFVPGEWLVARDTWFVEGAPVLLNSEEVRVVAAGEGQDDGAATGAWKVWLLEVRGADEARSRTLRVLHEDEHARYERRLARLKTAAREEQADWKPYYALRERFASVDYLYSMTVHKCLPEDACIETADGSRPLRDVRPGDLVWTGRHRLRPVRAVVHTGQRRVLRIVTRTGSVYRSSAEHRFLTPSGYVEAGRLRPADFLAIARPTEPSAHVLSDPAWLLGYLVGDGCYSYRSNRVDVTVHRASSLRPLLTSLLGQWNKVHVYARAREKYQAVTLSIEKKAFREWLCSRGLDRVTAVDKRAPRLYGPDEIRSFVQGLMDADGSASVKRACVRLVSVSSELLRQVKAMLLRFGIVAYLQPVQTPSSAHPAYCLYITGPSLRAFADHISFRDPEKRRRLEASLDRVAGKTNIDFIPGGQALEAQLRTILRDHGQKGKKGQGLYADKRHDVANAFTPRNLSWKHLETIAAHFMKRALPLPPEVDELLTTRYFYDEVVSVEYTEDACEMLDLEIEEDHTFVYDGAVVHNSQGSTFEVAYIDYRDTLACRGAEAQALLYVAVTRPSRRLALLV